MANYINVYIVNVFECKFKDNLCAATSYVTSLLNLLFHLHTLCVTCITVGLTRACNHANRVSGVNEYTFHVGHPELLKMLNVYLISIFRHVLSCVQCSGSNYPSWHNYEHFGRKGFENNI